MSSAYDINNNNNNNNSNNNNSNNNSNSNSQSSSSNSGRLNSTDLLSLLPPSLGQQQQQQQPTPQTPIQPPPQSSHNVLHHLNSHVNYNGLSLFYMFLFCMLFFPDKAEKKT